MSRWPIPATWEWAQVGDVADVVGGGTPSTSDEANFAENGTSWLTPADLSGYEGTYIARGARSLSAKGLATSNARVLPAGAVLFSSRAPIGYTVIAENPIATNQGFKNLVLGEGMDPRYVRYYLLASRDYAESMASGSTFKELSGARMKELLIPVPPVAEQRRIVAKLDELLASSHAARGALDAVPALLEQFRQSVLAAAFRGDLTADWRAAHRALADEWVWVHLQDLTTSLRGGTAETSLKTITQWPVLKSSAVRPGKVDLDDCSYLPGDKGPSSGYLLSDGDLLITRLSGSLDYVGNCGIVREIGDRLIAYPDRLFRARLAESAFGPYVEYAFEAKQLRAGFERAAKSSAGHQRISLSDVRRFRLPLPSVSEQEEVVRRINTLLDGATASARLQRACLQQIGVLERAILAKAFLGELVPQDPNDEAASVLLDRIRAERAAKKTPARKSSRRTSTRA